MTVAFDNTFLSLVFHPGAKPPIDPSTSAPVTHCRQRIEALVDDCNRRGELVIVPTPCLSELLNIVPDFEKAIGEIDRSAAFELAAFDARCAIDLADMNRKARAAGDKKGGIKAGWQEVKFDRQIAVIAKVRGSHTFYTDDSSQSAFAKEIGLIVKHSWDLDLPARYAQKDWVSDDDGK